LGRGPESARARIGHMYGIEVSVVACLRSGTKVDVAWLVDVEGFSVTDWSQAVALTPGGGRIGSLLGGALDSQLAPESARLTRGRVLDFEVDEFAATLAGLGGPGQVRCLLVPATDLPVDVWDLLARREAFALDTKVNGSEVESITLRGESAEPSTGEDVIVSEFSAVPTLVLVGRSKVVDAIESVAAVLGWKVQSVNEPGSATGLIATLSGIDKVVVAAHDLELAGAALMAALDSDVGYIGSMGSRQMQQNRADWLAYRGVTELGRVHGPAGLDIGAETPGEIAVSILAEAVAARPLRG
ncbi:MAG: XdhC family protein, partial [Acidimicrobiia bacterium]|nr:XdhC family protein [Acidimicrobiia bacterium]